MIAGLEPFEPPQQVPSGLRYLSARNIPDLFVFPNDMLPVPVESNHLNDQVLVRYYEREWKEIAR